MKDGELQVGITHELTELHFAWNATGPGFLILLQTYSLQFYFSAYLNKGEYSKNFTKIL
jgi:hypothetical protein